MLARMGTMSTRLITDAFLPFVAGLACFGLGTVAAQRSNAHVGDWMSFSGAVIGAAVTVLAASYQARRAQRIAIDERRKFLVSVLSRLAIEGEFVLTLMGRDKAGLSQAEIFRGVGFRGLIDGIRDILADARLAEHIGRHKALQYIFDTQREVRALCRAYDLYEKRRKQVGATIGQIDLARLYPEDNVCLTIASARMTLGLIE